MEPIQGLQHLLWGYLLGPVVQRLTKGGALFEDDRGVSRLGQLCSMRIARTSSGVTVRLHGEFDCSCVERFEQEVGSALEDASEKLVLDLGGLGFIDSSGLAALVTLSKETDERGLDYAVLCDGGEVRRVLRQTGLDGVLPLVGLAGAAPPR